MKWEITQAVSLELACHKGFRSEKTDSKIKQFTNQLKVLYPEDMKYIFDYVINKYGTEFVKMYNTTQRVTEAVTTGCS